MKRRERMTEAERAEYDRAVEWASWAETGPGFGTGAISTGPLTASEGLAGPSDLA